MTKKMISLLLAILMFAALPAMSAGAYAAGETMEYTIGAETMKDICTKNGLDYDFCKDAIIKKNDAFKTEEDFTKMKVGDKIILPKTNQDAADILGVELPDKLKPKAEGKTQTYVVKDKDTMIGICEKLKLDYSKCKAAILKLNGWSDYNLLTMHTGDKIKLPASDADAAVIAAAATPSSGSSSGSGTVIPGTVVPGSTATAAYMVPHVVKAGETIYGICQENGIDFSKYCNLIMQVSGITYASGLHVGDIVYLPSSTPASGSKNIVSHVVKGGETTYGICQALGIDYSANLKMITALNPGKNLSAIRTGDVLFFPAGSGSGSGGGSGSGSGNGSGSGSGSASGSGSYTPVSPKEPVTPSPVKPAEGVMYYLKEVTVKKDDTVYNLIKAEGFEYQDYYANVMLKASNLASFNSLKEGDKLMLVTKNASGAKIAVTGVKVKDGDTVIKMCDTAKISYSENLALITALNSGVNFNNLKTGDIIVLPKKA